MIVVVPRVYCCSLSLSGDRKPSFRTVVKFGHEWARTQYKKNKTVIFLKAIVVQSIKGFSFLSTKLMEKANMVEDAMLVQLDLFHCFVISSFSSREYSPRAPKEWLQHISDEEEFNALEYMKYLNGLIDKQLNADRGMVSPKAGNVSKDDLNELEKYRKEVKDLKSKLLQRDSEINILVNMVKGKNKTINVDKD
jgi:hypothetical protein